MLGDVDGVKMGTPRYSGVIAGDEVSNASTSSLIVFLSSLIDSLHSLISASR